MVRELADYDPVRAHEVLRWPLREALMCHLHHLKREATAAFRHETLVWAGIAPHSSKKVSAPKKPAILRPARPRDRERE